jgi:N-methylhydantoinase A
MQTLSADVGGTFTDLVLIDGEAGVIHLDKVPSTPGRAEAVLSGIRRVAERAGISPGSIDIFVHGFTVGTNAFLTRKGARISITSLNPNRHRLCHARTWSKLTNGVTLSAILSRF